MAILAAADRHRREGFVTGVVARDAQDEIAILRFDAPCAQLHVLRTQRGFHVGGGQAARRQRITVQPDAHRITLRAAQAHLRHAGQAGELVKDVALGVIGELKAIHRGRAHVEPDDRVGIAFDLADLGRIGFFGQAVGDAADRVAHVVGRRLDVARGKELDADVGAAVAAA